MGEWGALSGVLALELNEGALEFWEKGDPGGELPSENWANIFSSQLGFTRGGETPPPLLQTLYHFFCSEQHFEE